MPLVIEPSIGQFSEAAGVLPVRQFDQLRGLSRAFADALDDSCDPDLTADSFAERVRARVFGILIGSQDHDDRDDRLDC
jgi:hypothetical protein